MKLKINLTIAALLSLLSINAQERSLSLQACKEIALENHLSIINAQHDIDYAQQRIRETTGLGLPQIDITGKFNHFPNIPVTVIDASTFNPMAPEGTEMALEMGTEFTSNGTLQVNQLIFNGSYLVGLKASKAYKQFQELNAQSTKEDVIFNVIESYQLAVISAKNVEFAQELVVNTEKLLSQQEKLLTAEMITQESIDQIQFSLASVKNNQINAEIQNKNALNLLKLSMGISLEDKIILSDDINDLKNKSAVQGSISDNNQLKLLHQKANLSALNVKNSKAANLPSLYAFLSHSYNAFRNEFDFFEDKRWYPQTVWGLQLNIPIFSGFQRQAKISQNKIDLMKDENSIKLLEQNLNFQQIQLSNQLVAAESKLKLQESNIELAQKIYDNNLIRKEVGQTNAMLITQQQSQLISSQAQYLAAVLEVLKIQLQQDKLYNNITK